MTWELLKAVRLNSVFIFVTKAVCLSNTAKRFWCREEGTLQIKALGTTRKTERSRRSSARRLRAPVTQMHSGTLGKIAIDAIAHNMSWSQKQGQQANLAVEQPHIYLVLYLPCILSDICLWHTTKQPFELWLLGLRNDSEMRWNVLGVLVLHRCLFKDIGTF